MKLIFTFLFTFLISLGALEDKANNFNDTCYNDYEYYEEYVTIDNEAMYLNIKVGVYDEKVGYSICFLSGQAKQYELKVISKGKAQSLTSDDRGDYIIYFISLNNNYSLGIYMNNSLVKTIEFKDVSATDLIASSNKIQGKNQGFADVQYGKTSKLTFVLSIIFSCIIIIGIIVVIVLALTKKGLFNKENRIEQANDGMRFYTPHTEVEVIEEVKEEPIVQETKDTTIQEEPKEVYKKLHDDEDVVRDISKVLQERGFKTNYQELSMDEKNQVMIELMKMKNFKEITNEEYRSEVIKLWS